jgi:phosphate transport system permease protein
MKFLVSILGIFGSFIVVFILLFLAYFAMPILGSNSFGEFKLLELSFSSLAIATIATVLASAYSISIALTLNSIKSKRAKELSESFFTLLSSVPTVIYAFLGVLLIVPFVRGVANCSGYSLVGAGFVLSFVVTPTIVLFIKDSFNATPKAYANIIYSIGGSRADYELNILLKYNKKAIFSSFILGFARAIGDTMIALMVAGNAINYPTSLSISVRALTANIALLFGEDFDSIEFKSIFASGLILFAISIVVIALAKRVQNAK